MLQDDEEAKPLVSRIIHQLANYQGGVVPAGGGDHHDDEPPAPPAYDEVAADSNDIGDKAKKASKKKQKQKKKGGSTAVHGIERIKIISRTENIIYSSKALHAFRLL